MDPNLSKWLFRASTTLAPAVLDVVYELRKQLDGGGGFDWNVLASSALGVVVVALLHLSRAGTEQAERTAEVATGVNQDSDPEVEQPQ